MQLKRHSLLEATLNTASGFIVSLLLWIYVVIPIWDIKVDMWDNLAVTMIFTVASIARSYAWRRVFNGHTVHRQFSTSADIRQKIHEV